MKKLLLTSLVATSMLVYSCGGGGGSSSSGTTSSNKILIKGSFFQQSSLNRLLIKDVASFLFKPAYALDPNQVAKVLVFSKEGRYQIVDVKNGQFAVEVEKGSPVGIIFIGNNNQYLGYLTLKDGIDSLPLTNVKEGISVIDLKTLVSNNNVVEPTHNPLGNELPISEDEKKNIALMDDLFSSIVKQPDVDGNGVIDLLENKFFRMGVLYFVLGGKFENSLNPSVYQNVYINGYSFYLDAYDSNRPKNVYFSGPSGSGLSNSQSSQENVYEEVTTYFSPYVGHQIGSQDTKIPPAGNYTISYKSNTLRFYLPDQSSLPSTLILPVPSIYLNSDGTINKIRWVYKSPSGTSNINPKSLVKVMRVQIDGSGTPCENYPQTQYSNRIYNSPNLNYDVTEHTLKCQNISWSSVNVIYTHYTDIYGNDIVVLWKK